MSYSKMLVLTSFELMRLAHCEAAENQSREDLSPCEDDSGV